MTKHLAILRQPYLDYILSGKKTIESRFPKVKCAPFGMIKAEDVVLLKESTGRVKGVFEVAKVSFFENVSFVDLCQIRKYENEICSYLEEDFWISRSSARYVTLLWIKNVRSYPEPYAYPKQDRRGWVVLKDDDKG